MGRRTRCLATSLAVLVAVLSMSRRGGAAQDFLSKIGVLLGRPVGSFVEAVTTPTLENVEGSGHRLVEDVDNRLSGQIGRLGKEAQARIEQVDAVAKDRLSQADAIMAARIVQVDASANRLVEKSLGELDEISRKRVDQAARAGSGLIKQVDGVAQQRLAQADGILQERIEQVRGAAQASIAQVDDALAARIEQLDEVAERRIGTLDVVATKQGLNIEGTLLKVAALAAMLVFLVVIFRYLFTEAPALWNELKASDLTTTRRVASVAATSSRWIGLRLVVALVGIAGLYWLSTFLPLGARRNAERLADVHEKALAASVRALDFTRVRYHAAQLAVLAPERDRRHRALALKSELVRTVFTGLGLLRRAEGVRQVAADLEQVEAAYREAFGDDREEPDASIVKGYVTWQLATSRDNEYDAVEHCVRALETKVPEDWPVLLRPLAINYLRSYLDRPLPPSTGEGRTYTLEQLQAVLAKVDKEESVLPPLQHVLVYDGLVRELDAASADAYLSMLDDHAEYLLARKGLGAQREPKLADSEAGLSPAQRSVLEAKRRRQEHAGQVIAAWRRFDDRLRTDPWLAGTATALSAFTLNDAPLTQALWFQVRPDAPDLPARLATIKDPVLKAQIAPLRIAWARRLVNPLGENLRRVIPYEEAERFARFEEQTAAFGSAYVGYRVASRSGAAARDLGPLRASAAVGAARLGLFRHGQDGRRSPYATDILAQAPAAAPERREVDELLRTRSLRLL